MHAQSALIVDDSATARLMLARILKSMDIATSQARSGEEAIEAAGNNPPAMIFLDHLMPGLDGFETLKRLKHQASTASIPVVMYTSQNAARYVEEAKQLGAAGVITKQVGRSDLYELVEKILHEQAAKSAAASYPEAGPHYNLDDPDSLDPATAAPEYDLDVQDIELAHRDRSTVSTDTLILRRELVTGANDQDFSRPAPAAAGISLEQIASIEDNIKEAILTRMHAQDRALVSRLKWISVAAFVFAAVLLGTLFAQESHIDTVEARTLELQQQIQNLKTDGEVDQLNQRMQALALEHDRIDALEERVSEMRLMMREMIGILEDN